jgi:hypothetical protein
MRYAAAVVAAALMAVAGGASAQNPGPNSLTQKEVSEGWILLFDGETPFGWQPRTDARWEVKDGVVAAVPGSGKGVLSTTTEFGDFRLKAEFWIDDTANSGIFVRTATALDGNPPDVSGANAYEVNIFDKHPTWPTGSINDLAKTSSVQRTVGKWNTIEITAEGDHLVVMLNGKKTVDVRDSKFARGTVALQYNGEGEVKFRGVKLKPLGLKSIFNGKDLAGWKQIPDRKSVYTVTPEGWLNVKNGNGDIQSDAEFGDFVFQLDIISNGTHLNSGIFFRGIPGQFWSGYESQIRNQWMGDDRTKPVDFGTGAIYNRQPARRVIPNDREWFTKTIVAHGKHMAVWVNGIQVSDFFDVRPPNDNARMGYRAKPGVLSIQGHDPTTDLSFRNLNAAELPKARQ